MAAQPDPLDPTFDAAGQEWNVDPNLLRAIAGQESGGTANPNTAVSPKGARGRMQLMPDTAAAMGVTDTTDPMQNTFGGAKYFSQQLDRYGSPELALAAYNAGPGRLDGYTDRATGRHVPGWLQTIGDPRTGAITPQQFAARIPIQETANYVSGISQKYTALMANATSPGNGAQQSASQAPPAPDPTAALADPSQLPPVPRAGGDSLAAGLAQNAGFSGGGVVGAPPSVVLKNLASEPNNTTGAPYYLSSGISNAPAAANLPIVQQQIDLLRSKGYGDIRLVGTGARADLAPLNGPLSDLAASNGITFAGAVPSGTDGVHPANAAGYRAMATRPIPGAQNTSAAAGGGAPPQQGQSPMAGGSRLDQTIAALRAQTAQAAATPGQAAPSADPTAQAVPINATQPVAGVSADPFADALAAPGPGAAPAAAAPAAPAVTQAAPAAAAPGQAAPSGTPPALPVSAATPVAATASADPFADALAAPPAATPSGAPVSATAPAAPVAAVPPSSTLAASLQAREADAARAFSTTQAAVASPGMWRGVNDVSDTLATPLNKLAQWVDDRVPALASLDHATGIDPTAAMAAADRNRAAYDAAYGNDPTNQVGRSVGQMVATIPAMGAGGRLLAGAGGALADTAGPVLGGALRGVGNFLAGNTEGNFLTRGATLAANGATQGATAAGLTSSAQPNVPVGQQIANGATAGAVLAPLAGAAARVGTGAVNLLTGSGGQASPEIAQLAQMARDTYGIPITGPQMSTNSLVRIANDQSSKLPFSGAGALADTQQTAFNRAVANTFGETADRITPDVMNRAATRIGGVFNDVANRTTIQADPQLLADLTRISTSARNVLPANEQAPINRQIMNVLDAAQTGNGAISGPSYQAITGSSADLAQTMRAPDGRVGNYASQVRDALDSAFQRSAAPGDQAALSQARGQYRAMHTLDDLVEKSPDGNVSPALLMGQVRNASSRFDTSNTGMAYTGGGPLGDLSRIGQQFLKSQPDSGTAARVMVNSLLLGGQGTLGSAAAIGAINPLAAAAPVAGLAANRLAGAYLRSNGYANRLIAGTLNPQPALLQQAAPYVAPAGALTYNSQPGQAAYNQLFGGRSQ